MLRTVKKNHKRSGLPHYFSEFGVRGGVAYTGGRYSKKKAKSETVELDSVEDRPKNKVRKSTSRRRYHNSNVRGNVLFPWYGEVYLCPVCGKRVYDYLGTVPYEIKCPRCRGTMILEKINSLP
jgi:hypothetical protein